MYCIVKNVRIILIIIIIDELIVFLIVIVLVFDGFGLLLLKGFKEIYLNKKKKLLIF